MEENIVVTQRQKTTQTKLNNVNHKGRHVDVFDSIKIKDLGSMKNT